jgi:hypothetical protein
MAKMRWDRVRKENQARRSKLAQNGLDQTARGWDLPPLIF